MGGQRRRLGHHPGADSPEQPAKRLQEKLKQDQEYKSCPNRQGNQVNSLYNMVDQVFIGQGVGYLGNAATNVIMPLTTILMAIAFMLGDGPFPQSTGRGFPAR